MYMNNTPKKPCPTYYDRFDLFESIAKDLYDSGYSIKPLGLPQALTISLQQYADSMKAYEFDKAGVGRESTFNVNRFIRTDSIHWINGNNEIERTWNQWLEAFKTHLNKSLFLGLFSFESHFAWYQKGQFYKRHYDAFQGESNRKLSVVVYLNDDWQLTDGGELVLYKNEHDNQGIRILPRFATLVVFLSEEFPHEVLPSNRDRLSIAGWFRVNQSINGHIVPPE